MQDGTILKQDYLEVSDPPHHDQPILEHQDCNGRFAIGESCTIVSDLLSRIGDKWSILVVSYLGNGTMRFSEIRREIDGISQKVLTSTLRNLERDGFIHREVYPTIPPKVEYSLTDLGQELLCPVSALGQWAVDNAKKVNEARQKFDKVNAKKR